MTESLVISSTAAMQANGKTLVGGFFTATNGQAAGSLARLNANGTTTASVSYAPGSRFVHLKVELIP